MKRIFLGAILIIAFGGCEMDSVDSPQENSPTVFSTTGDGDTDDDSDPDGGNDGDGDSDNSDNPDDQLTDQIPPVQVAIGSGPRGGHTQGGRAWPPADIRVVKDADFFDENNCFDSYNYLALYSEEREKDIFIKITNIVDLEGKFDVKDWSETIESKPAENGYTRLSPDDFITIFLSIPNRDKEATEAQFEVEFTYSYDDNIEPARCESAVRKSIGKLTICPE